MLVAEDFSSNRQRFAHEQSKAVYADVDAFLEDVVAIERDMIGHPGEEFAYVVYGAIELLYGEERIALAQGDSVRFRTETPHAFRNASVSGVAVVVGAATPPW